MDLTCKRCQTPLSVDDKSRKQKMVACPNCRVVNSLVSREEMPADALRPAIQKWGLPKGITLEEDEGNLFITRSWLNNQTYLFLVLGLVWNGFLIAIASQATPWIYLMPHGWAGVWFLYKAITGLLNTTVIEVGPDQLSIATGPIPSFSDQKLAAGSVLQLYVERKEHKNKNSTSYTYDLELIGKLGGRKTLIKGMSVPQQALYLEHAIEQHLGIEDKILPDEYRQHTSSKRQLASWQRLARFYQLTFTQSKVLEGTRLSGDYKGLALDMAAFRKGENENSKPYTGLSLIRKDNPNGPDPAGQPLTAKDLERLFTPRNNRYRLKGQVEVRDSGRELYYEQAEIESEDGYLKSLIQQLGELMDAYPQILSLGGQVTPILRTLATDTGHPLRKVAVQLLKDIASTTMHLEAHLPQLVCEKCLTGFDLHRADLNWPDVVTYYGCRVCHQSSLFYAAETVVAVLDRQMETDIFQSGQTLNVNWLQRRSLFDFDAVEIRRAEDKDVEQFAMQIGNDTDPVRKQRYEKMVCIVSPFCSLSKNTLRILERTFAQVTVTPLLHDVDDRTNDSDKAQRQSYHRLQSDQPAGHLPTQLSKQQPTKQPPMQTNKE